jgi:hypothetical protein
MEADMVFRFIQGPYNAKGGDVVGWLCESAALPDIRGVISLAVFADPLIHLWDSHSY